MCGSVRAASPMKITFITDSYISKFCTKNKSIRIPEIHDINVNTKVE